MAITKTGASLSGIKSVLSGALSPGHIGKVTGALGRGIGRAAMPGTLTAGTAYSISAGDQSAGEGLGDLVGGTAGFNLANKLLNKVPSGSWRSKALKFILSGVGATAGAMAGGSTLGKIAPYKRAPRTAQDYLEQ